MAVRQESRRFGRRATNVLAWIKVDGRPKLCCSIRNLTPIGAFLELTPPGWLPFKFVLELEHDGTLIGCEIRHTRPAGIGVEFVPIEAVAEYASTSRDTRTQGDEWLGNPRQTIRAPSADAERQTGGPSLVSQIRASINNKR